MKKNNPSPSFALHSVAMQTQAMMQQAFALHQGGQLAQAQQRYEGVLKLQPDHADAFHLLGLIGIQTNDHRRAVDLIGKAIELFPKNPGFHFNHAFALLGVNRLEEAIAAYDQAIALKPDYAEAHSNRGNVLKELGRLEAAVASYDKAIAVKPDFVDAYCNRGLVLQALKQTRSAIASYDKAIALQPDNARAHANRGMALQELKQTDAAIASYDKAIGLQPDFADAHFHRAIALQEAKRLEAAIAGYDRTIAIKPDFAEAHSNRGLALQELGQPDAALAGYEQAIGIAPDYAEAYFNRGTVLQELKQLDAAIASYDKAIALKPDYAQAYSNRGAAQQALMQMDAALASYSLAATLKPDYAEAHLNKALLQLLTGDYAQGWKLHEWRWRCGAQAKFARGPAVPLWLGEEPLHGKTILLYAEQGFGDTLQFCRYANAVAALGAQVVVEAPQPLVDLLNTLDGVASVTTSVNGLEQTYDYRCPLMSLPLAFKTTLETVPAVVPYLKTVPSKAAYWRDRLQASPGPRVGLVWSGDPRRNQPELWEMNAHRNIPLLKFAALNMPALSFYSLQVGKEAQAQWRELEAAGWNGPRIEDYTDELRDFSDTAALIENLDLVISVDTAVAHLAGALGKPVWLLNRYDTCWRWLLEREDTPWYPSMRIFRQAAPGDWEGVMARVESELRKLNRS